MALYFQMAAERLFSFGIRILTSAVSTSLLPALYLIKSSYRVLPLCMLINCLLYLAIPTFLSWLVLLWYKNQSQDSISHEVKALRSVDNEYLPIYLGYFFVVLSIPTPVKGQIDTVSLMVVYLMVCLFVSCSKSLAFNPIFIMFGYGYYKVTTISDVDVFVISKQEIGKNSGKRAFPNLRKISGFVFLDIDK